MMTEATSEIVERLKLATRPNASPKLLARKAVERAAQSAGDGEAIEDAFPVSAAAVTAAPPPPGPAMGAKAVLNTQPAQPLPTWSDEDERAFQAMSVRRRAAGYQRRGRDVNPQRIQVGSITPNPNTVTSVIVGLVTGAGELTRSALLDAMAGAAFPHPKARPQDRGWCQGYVAGAVRDGFLQVVQATAVEPAEASR